MFRSLFAALRRLADNANRAADLFGELAAELEAFRDRPAEELPHEANGRRRRLPEPEGKGVGRG